MNNVILEVRNLKTYFRTSEGVVKAVDGVTWEIRKREAVGLVGESGSGKTVMALSLLRLVPHPGQIVDGSILLDGKDLLKLSDAEMRKVRGKDISMIFQEPMAALNPILTIGKQISESLVFHKITDRKGAIDRTIRFLELVRIPCPKLRIQSFPHQLSGGMRQRAMIAMALIRKPKILVADEPTTSLDVTIQAQVLDLMQELMQLSETSVILITHNLALVAQMVTRVFVVYAGRIMEQAEVNEFFDNPLHPYSRGLLNSLPRIDVSARKSGRRLLEIPGAVPALHDLPEGCSFSPRCPNKKTICTKQEPEITNISGQHSVACWLYS